MVKNKRQASRYPVANAEADLRLLPLPFLRSNLAERAVDLSNGGVRLVASEPLKPGDRVKLEISFPGRDDVAIRSTARVVWRRTQAGRQRSVHHLGLAFEADPREMKDALDRLTMSRRDYLASRMTRRGGRQ